MALMTTQSKIQKILKTKQGMGYQYTIQTVIRKNPLIEG